MATDMSAVNLAPNNLACSETIATSLLYAAQNGSLPQPFLGTSRLFQDTGTSEPFQFKFGTAAAGASGAGSGGVVHILSAGALNANPFRQWHQMDSAVKRRQELVANQNVTLGFLVL